MSMIKSFAAHNQTVAVKTKAERRENSIFRKRPQDTVIISSSDVVAHNLTAKSTLKSGIDKAWAQKAFNESYISQMRLGLFSAGGLLVVGVTMFSGNLVGIVPDLAITGGLLPASLVATGGIVGLKKHLAVKWNKIVDRAISINSTFTKHWLKQRYSLEVSTQTLDDLATLLTLSEANRVHSFKDVTGNHFTFKSDENREFLVEKEVVNESKTVEYKPATVASLEVGKYNLSDVAKVKLNNIQTLFNRISEHDLDIESEHILSRVQSDLDKSLVLNEKAFALDPELYKDEGLVSILSGLESELTRIIDSEVASVQKELNIQASVVASRSYDRIEKETNASTVLGHELSTDKT